MTRYSLSGLSTRVRNSGFDAATALTALLAIAIVVGAGGVSAALGNLAVVLAALALLAAMPGRAATFARSAPRPLVALVAASVALPLLQLVPLPPAVWEAMPGRELVAGSLDVAGGRGWYPLSLDRGRTLVAFVGTIAPATVIAIGWTLDPARLAFVLRAAVAIGVGVVLFGALHFVDAVWGDLYAGIRPLEGVMVGTFADRTAAALFFVGCLSLIAGLPEWRPGPIARMAWLSAAAILVVAVVLTRSRTGIVLLTAPALLAAARMFATWRGERRARRSPVVPLAGAGAAAIAIALVFASGQARTSLDRFGGDDGMRAEMREDAMFAARRYWPVGAGMGTFDEVFQVDESLEYVSPREAGRAHMDYLELAIEAGIGGLLILAGWFAWIAFAGLRALRTRGAWAARAGLAILVTIAAQSILAFPLRNQAMLCFAALALVALARSPIGRRKAERPT